MNPALRDPSRVTPEHTVRDETPSDNDDSPADGIQGDDAETPDKKKAIKIANVTKDGPAEKAGLKVGDLIAVVNDKPVEGNNTLQQSVEDGATVALFYENRTPELRLQNVNLNED